MIDNIHSKPTHKLNTCDCMAEVVNFVIKISHPPPSLDDLSTLLVIVFA